MRTLLLFLGLWCVASAQTVGEITGEVKDPSGADIANAPVTATNTATNVGRSTATNNAGVYSFPDLAPGTYQVKVAAPGFDTVIKTNIELQVQQTARIDFTLSVGQTTQTIEVSATGALLSTEDATVGTVIEERRITELPLNGRNFFSLVALSPNVTFGFTPAQQASGRLGGTRSTLTMSLAGARATWANYTLDGITNTDVDFNTYIVLPSVDALQEFKVQSGIYPAEFGREAGQVNVSTKPGTNAYHGTLFEFFRNNVLDARDYDFSSSTRSATNPSPGSTPYRQNQYGFTLGGPVQIPKLFNGKNRLFFMSNFEGFKSRRTTTTFATTLTAAMRAGDFSAIPTPLQDPLTRTGTFPNITSSAFAGNRIPPDRFDKNSVLLMSKFFPLPNQPATAGVPNRNYQYLVDVPVDKNQFNQRIDFNEKSNSQWFGRYSWTDELTVNPGLTTDGFSTYTRASQWVLSNVRVFSPTKVNEARFGYNSLFNNIAQQLAGIEDVDAEIGVPIKVTDKNSWGVPNIQLSQNLTSFGNATSSPFQINDKVFQGVDNFSWNIGKHSLRMGGEYRYNQFPQIGNEFPRGQFFFNGQFTNAISSTGAQSGGYSGADFLLGAVQNSIIAVSLVSADFRNSEWAAYIDDTWKVRPHLTISAGLRWEVAQPMFDASGREVNVQLNDSLASVPNVGDLSKHPVYVRTGTGDFYEGVNFRYKAYWAAQGATIPGSPPFQVARDGRLGSRLINTNYDNFAPRLGIAWSPSDKWSIRTGFGIFFSQESKNSIFDLNRGLGGRTGQVTPTTYGKPTFGYTNFIDTASLPVTLPVGLTWGADRILPTTYSMTYMLNIQRLLGKSTTLELGYNGSESRHLANLINAAAPIPGTSSVLTRLPYPEFGAAGIQFLKNDGVGNYNGFGTKLSQRFGTHLTSLLSYTWSKALDDGSAIRGPGTDFVAPNARCRACDYGYAAFDVPHRFVASVLYTLPFGRGERFLNHGGILNQVVGGWQLSTITTLQSGPTTETGSWDSAGVVFSPNGERLNCVAGVDPVLPNHNQNGWYNAAAFSNPVGGTFGNCARNNLRGPKQVNIDLSTIKDFRITESQALQFRLELFNAPNHVELGTPAATWNGSSGVAPPSNFGVITTTRTSMRQIQLALKYNF
ncbi:MAG: carboxypeptidase-like regulatory domain-containing protein [Acidobacteriota bacterium]|nr:carboxypeptidase-like regulatory domain-containing protein [Acidobacteriota bacterium]